MIFYWLGTVVLYKVRLECKWLDFIAMEVTYNSVFEQFFGKALKKPKIQTVGAVFNLSPDKQHFT
jgi:hypothetical protein